MAYRKSSIPNFPALAKQIARAANARMAELMRKYAEHTRDDFVQRIKDQRFTSFRVILYPESGTNLSPRWLEEKIAHGADTRTMIATEHYIRSIDVFRTTSLHGRRVQWRVGFNPKTKAVNLKGEPQKITLEHVAMIHEHGNQQTPARPHWGPNYNRLKREAPAVRRFMRDEIRKIIRKTVSNRMVVKGPK